MLVALGLLDAARYFRMRLPISSHVLLSVVSRPWLFDAA